MSLPVLVAARCVLFSAVVAFVTVCPAWLSTTAHADDPVVTVVKVEEDWELVISSPDPGSNGPQISCVMSPLGDLDSLHSIFYVNHKMVPQYRSGGLQLEVCAGSETVDHCGPTSNGVLSQSGEAVTWTQTMTLSEGQLAFEIIGGQSLTWGAFGGNDLRASVATQLSNLNEYHPAVSVDNSGVGFASNRVQSLTLKQVRWTLDTGAVVVDDNDHVVHQKDAQ